MLTTAQLLDAAKRGQSITSDYRLCRVLGVTDHTLYNYRHGRTPADEQAVRLAAMAGIHPGFVLCCLGAERAKEESLKAIFLDSARVIAAAFPGQTTDILSLQLRTPDRLKTPMNTGSATMATGEREYTS